MKLTWYEGGKRPPAEVFLGENVSAGSPLFIGEKGRLLTAPATLFRGLYQKYQPTADILHYKEGKIANVVVYDFPCGLVYPPKSGDVQLA